MTQVEIVTMLRDALSTVLTMATPFLAVSIAVGILVAVVQAATQIHEQNVGFVFKIFAIALLLVVLGSWLLAQGMDFFTHVFSAIDSMN
jgi:flagellar biosynthetic protein FliQ